jgi:hypothetical protein
MIIFLVKKRHRTVDCNKRSEKKETNEKKKRKKEITPAENQGVSIGVSVHGAEERDPVIGRSGQSSAALGCSTMSLIYFRTKLNLLYFEHKNEKTRERLSIHLVFHLVIDSERPARTGLVNIMFHRCSTRTQMPPQCPASSKVIEYADVIRLIIIIT